MRPENVKSEPQPAETVRPSRLRSDKMGDSIAERMDAGRQAARHWETECEAARNQLAAVTAERDAYLETIRATFRVLESRGQAPDDNAPLSVTVRRVLAFLDTVTSERDAAHREVERLRGWLDFISENPRGGHVTYVHAQNALSGAEVPK